MLNKFKIVLILLICHSIGFAASSDPVSLKPADFNSNLDLYIAYYGEFVAHPGMAMGGEKILKGGRTHRLFGAVSLGGYRHVDNHIGIFSGAELGYRLMASIGPYLDALVGLGFHHSVPDGPTYTRVDGEVEKTRNWGQFSVMPSISLSMGWDFSRNNLVALRIFNRVQLFGRYPINGLWVPDLSVMFGFAVKSPWKI